MRFQLRTLLTISVGVAVAVALLTELPELVAAPIVLLFTIVMPALLTGGVVYQRGDGRAFCLGGLFPAGMMFLVTAGWLLMVPLRTDEISMLTFSVQWFRSLRRFAAMAWFMIVVTGGLAVLVRRFSVVAETEVAREPEGPTPE